MICAAFKTLLLLETTFWKLKMLGANLTCMSQRNSAVLDGTIFPMFLAMVILMDLKWNHRLATRWNMAMQ